ncbi:MAG: DUF968 domain-containing protein [Rhodoplanes sp.]|nr:DUF968 domain-containing protein [Rhodoplanes sp.]
MLPLHDSALTRDALLTELAGFSTATDVVAWAQRTLRIKNSLTAVDATAIESAFALILQSFDDHTAGEGFARNEPEATAVTGDSTPASEVSPPVAGGAASTAGQGAHAEHSVGGPDDGGPLAELAAFQARAERRPSAEGPSTRPSGAAAPPDDAVADATSDRADRSDLAPLTDGSGDSGAPIEAVADAENDAEIGPAVLGTIDKSVLTIATPKRYRDKAHLGFVARRACLVCGRKPCDPHHLRFAQPRALGRKVSDEFTVPLCRTHHRVLHRSGNETTWWTAVGIDPLPIANELWARSRAGAGSRRPRGRPHSVPVPDGTTQEVGNSSPISTPH